MLGSLPACGCPVCWGKVERRSLAPENIKIGYKTDIMQYTCVSTPPGQCDGFWGHFRNQPNTWFEECIWKWPSSVYGCELWLINADWFITQREIISADVDKQLWKIGSIAGEAVYKDMAYRNVTTILALCYSLLLWANFSADLQTFAEMVVICGCRIKFLKGPIRKSQQTYRTGGCLVWAPQNIIVEWSATEC